SWESLAVSGRRGPSESSRSKKSAPLYAELHASSAFSFLNGASLPEDLVEEAARLSIPAVALVDSNGVYGALRFNKAAKAAGIKGLVGAEIRIENEELRIKNRKGRPTLNSRLSTLDSPRLTLLVENRTGYKNLCRLLTAGALDKPKGEARVTWEQIAAHSDGLHCLTGGQEGLIAQTLSSRGLDAGRRELERLSALFPGRLYVELQRHFQRIEEHRNQALRDLAGHLLLPYIATNGVRYARAQDKELHDILTSIAHHTTLDRAGTVLAAERERHFKDAAGMA